MGFSFRLLLLCLCAGSVLAETWPAPPADGVLDGTHALSEPDHIALAEEIAALKRDLGIDVWFSADTFLTADQSLKDKARQLRQAWSGEADATLLAYDRGTDTLHLTFSPGLWQRFASADIIRLIQRCGLIMAERQRLPSDRLRDALSGLLKSLREMERDRLKTELTWTRDHRRLAVAFGSLTGLAAMLMLGLGSWLQHRDRRASVQCHFPEVEVSSRLGAACGGGVVVVWQAEQP
jgi:hypothetical protein